MYGVIFSFLLTLLITFKVTLTCENNSLETPSAADSSVAAQLLKLTSKMDTVEAQLQTTKDELQTTKDELQKTKAEQLATKDELQATMDELQKTKADLQTTNSELQTTQANQEKAEAEQRATKSEVGLLRSRESNPGSSSFVRWGRKSCPGNTKLVYYGVAGGKNHGEKGSGTNRLCLTKKPEFDYSINPRNAGYVFGGEYDHIVGHHDHDVPCSVCLAPESTTIMVPATRTCPPTWTRQYYGHLASQHTSHAALDYVCLDQNPEDEPSGRDNRNGNLFAYTKARCGSLACPPYQDFKILTCVVCSK